MRPEWQIVRCGCGEDARHLKGNAKRKRCWNARICRNDYVGSEMESNEEGDEDQTAKEGPQR